MLKRLTGPVAAKPQESTHGKTGINLPVEV